MYTKDKPFELTVPVPPTINHAYFYLRGRKIKNNVARLFDNQIKKIFSDLEFVRFEDKTKIVCEMLFFFPDNRRRDAHNTLKLLFDQIETEGLYKDDKYVLPRIINFEVDKEKPRLELKFYVKED